MKTHPVILSGGSGTRLWPLSREHFPKQLLNLVGEESLLQQTVRRLDSVEAAADPIVVCNEEHRFLIAEQLREMGARPAKIILEPVGRNTCPAVTLAALALLQDESRPLMLVMPADHVMENVPGLHRALTVATGLAIEGRLVTFGVAPTSAATGYGYIRKAAGHTVAEFVEKPDAATAERYLASGNYLWNSGIFLMRADVWIDEMQRFAPDILTQCQMALSNGKPDGDFYRIDEEAFRRCKSNSVDYAVMEKTNRASVVPLDAGWSDVGAWSALWEVLERDNGGNVLQGDVCQHDVSGTLIFAQHRLVAAVGLNNLIVVETPDAVLVADKDKAEEVKTIVEKLRSGKRSEYVDHRRVYRPWGCYEGIDTGERFQVKRLTVKPGAALSLQMHHHRAEHWVVVRGTARVTRDDQTFLLTENQSTYIPIGVRHRLENPGTIPLEIIEVQSGSYLGEDDIVRYDDRYSRIRT
ncbi:MAG: mannose-1-phosphate guanylyltransferase/mannose-6-phosphate isomerase [Sulfurifustis sp.]